MICVFVMITPFVLTFILFFWSFNDLSGWLHHRETSNYWQLKKLMLYSIFYWKISTFFSAHEFSFFSLWILHPLHQIPPQTALQTLHLTQSQKEKREISKWIFFSYPNMWVEQNSKRQVVSSVKKSKIQE